MKNNILSILFIVLYLNTYSQTTIPANSQVSGTWTKSGSPYLIKGNISVPLNSTLVIEPGVQVRFDGKYMFGVYGKIIAIGKVGDTIRFYPQDTLNRWRGLRYFGTGQATDSATFKHCIFEYAGPKLNNFENALKLNRGHFNVQNCVFRYNASNTSASAFICDSILSLTFKRNYIYRNVNKNSDPSVNYGIGGAVGISGSATIDSCIFEQNHSSNAYFSLDKYAVEAMGSGGTLSVSDYSNPNAKVNISNCTFIKNYGASKGSAIHIAYRNSGKLYINQCEFKENFSGRYGAITYVYPNISSRINAKIVIDKCLFDANKAANTYIYAEAAAIALIDFTSNDSIIIRNNTFTRNLAAISTVYVQSKINDKHCYFYNNVFKNNYSGCIMASGNSQVISRGNLFYNNLYSIYIYGKTPSNQYYSINDLYAYNGYNVDSFWYDQQIMQNSVGNYYKFAGGVENQFSTAGVFRNCIFWENKKINGETVHLRGNDVRFQEVSNCIMSGNTDSTIAWSTDVSASKPNPMVISKQNVINKAPLFVNAPSGFGPTINTTGVDFHLMNSCNQLSPAYNTGMNAALNTWNNVLDIDGMERIICDTIDIGPYELKAQKRMVKITDQPQDTSVCEGEVFNIPLSTKCADNIQLQWQKRINSVWSNDNSNDLYFNKTLEKDVEAIRLIVKQLECNVSDTSRTVSTIQHPNPKPFLGNDTTINNKQTLVLNFGTYSSYIWQDGSQNQNYTIDGSQVDTGRKLYHIKVKNQFNCEGSDSIFVTVIRNSSLENLVSKGWKIYPNPTTDYLNIVAPNLQKYNWTLMDAFGKLIFKNQSEFETNILTQDLPNGVYYLQIQTESGSEVIKILKTNN